MHPFYFCVCLAHKYRHMLVINIWSEDYEIILPELNPCCQNWRSPEVFLTEVRRRSTSCMQTHWFFAVARCVNHHADNSFLWTFKRLFFFLSPQLRLSTHHKCDSFNNHRHAWRQHSVLPHWGFWGCWRASFHLIRTYLCIRSVLCYFRRHQPDCV